MKTVQIATFALWILMLAGLATYAGTSLSKRVVPSGQISPDVSPDLKNVLDNFQQRGFRVYLSTPNVSELREGEIVIVSSTTKSIFFRSNDALYRVTATAN